VFFLSVLFLTGTFNSKNEEIDAYLDVQLDYMGEQIEKDYGEISLRSIYLSKILSESIEKNLSSQGVESENFREHPELITEILNEACGKMVYELGKTKSSGVFIILDTTINPNIVNAENSKAGVYVRNMEPNVINLETPYFQFLKGAVNYS
jgi:hypothetical protein